jgi:superfamily II DNA or RNA helicase
MRYYDYDSPNVFRSHTYKLWLEQELRYSEVKSNKPLWTFQKEAINAVIPKLDVLQPTVLHVATGGGKTRIANNILREWLRLHGGPIMWVSKDWRLLTQAVCDLAQRHPSIRYERDGGDGKNLHWIPDGGWSDVVYSTIQSAQRNMGTSFNRFPNWDRPSLVVWDECHWGENAGAREILNECRDMRVPVLGLSATPRARGRYRVTYSKPFNELVEKGILARPVIDDRSPVQTGVAWRPELRLGEIIPSSLRTLAESVTRNERIVFHYLENQSRFGKTILFACDVAHCNALVSLFQKHGVRAASAHSKQSEATTQGAIRDFSEGSLQVLVNVEMLTHGVDLPITKTVFLCRPTTSDILFSQMVGRAARRGEGATRKDSFLIVEFTDNIQQHGDMLVTAKSLYWGTDAPGAQGYAEPVNLTSPALHPLVSEQRLKSSAWIGQPTHGTVELKDRGRGLFLVGDPLDRMRIAIADRMDAARALGIIVNVQLSGADGGYWYVSLRGNPGVFRGLYSDPDWTVNAHVYDWLGYLWNPSAVRWRLAEHYAYIRDAVNRVNYSGRGKRAQWEQFLSLFAR